MNKEYYDVVQASRIEAIILNSLELKNFINIQYEGSVEKDKNVSVYSYNKQQVISEYDNNSKEIKFERIKPEKFNLLIDKEKELTMNLNLFEEIKFKKIEKIVKQINKEILDLLIEREEYTLLVGKDISLLDMIEEINIRFDERAAFDKRVMLVDEKTHLFLYKNNLLDWERMKFIKCKNLPKKDDSLVFVALDCNSINLVLKATKFKNNKNNVIFKINYGMNVLHQESNIIVVNKLK